MRILIIGGTKFLGRHLVDAATARGHQLTLFNRGETGPELYPEIEQVRGDREHDLDRLRGRSWDAVIDTCGYEPGIVERSVRALADSVRQYVYISSVSVYADPVPRGAEEDAPLAELAPGDDEEDAGARYGPLKALCERAVLDGFPERALIVRAGLLVGPHDPTDRFRYWIRRMRRGGAMLAPGSPARAVQLIDARDLAEWVMRCVEEGVGGTYNVSGPREPLTMGGMLDALTAAAGGAPEPVWVPEDFLLEQGVGPWVELPFWLPEADNGILEVGLRRAFAAGLRIRPLGETVRDADDRGDESPASADLPSDAPTAGTLTAEREAELLAAWRERGSSTGT
jgi:2'-hydroxyisoflavone reductase